MDRGISGRRRALVAGLVALASLSGGFAALGAPPAGAATSEANPDLQAAWDLAAYVPRADRGTCIRVDPKDFANGDFSDAEAVLSCNATADVVDGLIYAKYPTAEALQAAYTANIPAGLPTGETGTPCPVETTWSYAGEGGGSDACFVNDFTNSDGEAGTLAKVVWTADDQLILGFAVSEAGDADALKKWWSEESGPLKDPDSAGLATLTETAYAKAGKKLAAAAPAAAKKCKTLDASLDEENAAADSPDYLLRPWIAAEIDCSVPKGSVRFVQVDPAQAEAYSSYLQSYLFDSEYPGLQTPAACDEPADLQQGKKTVGQIQCWYYQDTLWVGWYNEKTGVVGGLSSGLSPAAALKYAKANLT